MPETTLLEAMDSPKHFAPWFRDRDTWAAWRAFIATLTGEPLSEDQLAIYQQCTGRSEPPQGPFSEAWLVCGRRSGKSRMLAMITVFMATMRKWSPFLSPGERATILVMAADKRQARTIMRYALGMLEGIPAFSQLLDKRKVRDEEIPLSNGVTLEISAASFRSVRGYSIPVSACDEIGYWRSDESSANPDSEILAALRPAGATFPGGGLLLCASSPYARRGMMWEAYRRHYGRDGAPVLVWQADTRTMNPTVPQSFIDEAYAADEASARAEYGAQFRTDIEGFLTREVIDAVTVPGRDSLPFSHGARHSAFVDPSGGSRDSMTMAIAHQDRETAVLDVIVERRPPFSPEAVVEEFCGILKQYGITSVRGDRYGGAWPAERFSVHGIRYEPAEKPKSDLYRELLPLMTSGKAELLDHPRLQAQLLGLERRTARGGRDSIDHAPGAHDDIANAVAGALVSVSSADDIVGDLIRAYGDESEAWLSTLGLM